MFMINVWLCKYFILLIYAWIIYTWSIKAINSEFNSAIIIHFTLRFSNKKALLSNKKQTKLSHQILLDNHMHHRHINNNSSLSSSQRIKWKVAWPLYRHFTQYILSNLWSSSHPLSFGLLEWYKGNYFERIYGGRG